MGEITLTLQEVIHLPNLNLFEPHNYIDYPHVQRMIVEHYIDREIAYETADLFKLKLNHYLDIFESNYNRMLKAQLIDIDPFVTEYIVSDVENSIKHHADEKNASNSARDNSLKSFNANTGAYSENYVDTSTVDHKKDSVSTGVTGKLQSEATNTTGNETIGTTSSETSKTTKDDAINKTIDTTLDKIESETKKITRTQNETTDYSENKEINDTTNKTKKEDVTSTDNQTGREWKENGSTEGHRLGVASDTPQAMLFNEPNHYYGTGRAHDYGVVKQDAEGNDYYQHYPETEPSEIDSGSYTIGSGDTPWFNYASAASNSTGHDSYAKNGSETYNRSGTSVTNTTENSTTDKTEDTTGNKEVELNETENTNTDKTTKETTNTAENSKENEITDFTSSKTESTNKDNQESVARNLNEHTKEDTTQGEIYSENGTDKYDKTGNTTSDSTKNQKVNELIDSIETKAKKEKTNSNTKTVRKGRSMRSPAQLLAEYRTTLTFNADAWLLGELTPLFLELY